MKKTKHFKNRSLLFLFLLFSFLGKSQNIHLGESSVLFLGKDLSFTTSDQVITKTTNSLFGVEAGSAWATPTEHVAGQVRVFGAGTTVANIGNNGVSSLVTIVTTNTDDQINCEYKNTAPAGSLENTLNTYYLSDTEHWEITKQSGSSSSIAISGVTPLSTALYNGEVGMGEMQLVAFNPTSSLWESVTNTTPFGNYAIAANFAVNLALTPKVFLQGAVLPDTGSGVLMNDLLRTSNSIPATSPYADALQMAPNVLSVQGINAIVDWVWIELRDTADDTVVKYQRSALLQRDGDIVDVDGVSLVEIIGMVDSYYVVVNHHNHLGVMTQNGIALTTTESEIDFTTSALATHGSSAQIATDGRLALMVGDTNNDGVLKYSGGGSDGSFLLSTVLNDAGNFLNLTTYSFGSYGSLDINMDGLVSYSGNLSDSQLVLTNVLGASGNMFNLRSFTIDEQLPESIGIGRLISDKDYQKLHDKQ